MAAILRPVLLSLLTVVLGLAPALSAPLPTAFAPVLAHYEAIRLQLVEDSVSDVAQEARSLLAATEQLAASPDRCSALAGEQQASCQEALAPMVQAAKSLTSAKDLVAIRAAFESFSEAAIRYRGLHGEGAAVAYCPMLKKHWLQADAKQIGNPYAGQSMPRCGKFVAK